MAPGRNQDSGSSRVRKGRKGPSAVFPDFQGGVGVKFLIDDLSRDKVAFARDGFTESGQNGQRVSVRSPRRSTRSGCRRCSDGGGE